VEDVIRDAFTRARAYQREWKDYEARKARGEEVAPPGQHHTTTFGNNCPGAGQANSCATP
jgi:hypothetical protein